MAERRGDRRRHTVPVEPRSVLSEIIDTFVRPRLLLSGFTGGGTIFRRRAPDGTLAVVSFRRLSWPEPFTVFHVDLAAMPAAQVDWLAHLHATAVPRSPGIAYGLWRHRVSPSPSPRQVGAPGDRGAWVMDNRASLRPGGHELAAALDTWLPTVAQLVDRRRLLELVCDPTTPPQRLWPGGYRSEIVLLIDDGRSARLSEALRCAADDGDHEIVAWATRRLAARD